MDKITASLTTMRERYDSLRDTVKSLLPQVDKLNVYLHGYDMVPDFLRDKKIEVVFDIEHGDNGDLDKSYWIDKVEGYHLICDDDLIYPADYAEKMVEGLLRHNNEVIMSFYGSILLEPPLESYYKNRYSYPYNYGLKSDSYIDIPGTGGLAYHSKIELGKTNFRILEKNMLDIHMGIWAKQNKVKVYCIAHPAQWVEHTMKIDLNKTIWAEFNNADELPTAVVNANGELFGDYYRAIKPFLGKVL